MTRIRSYKRPSPIETDEFNVYINTTVTERIIDGNTVYIYDQARYSKDEYITLLHTQLTNTQLALVELYESIGGEQ